MGKSIVFINRNELSIFSLLLIAFLTSGFAMLNDGELTEKKKRKKIVKTAQKYIGTKYKAGGKNPKGFDCSGFSYFIFKENNIKIGASSRAQSLQGEPTKIKHLQPGDLVFFGSKKRISHVGIIVEQTRKKLIMVHSSSSRGIVEEDIYASPYWTKRLQFGKRMI